jgi:hypothetical protein
MARIVTVSLVAAMALCSLIACTKRELSRTDAATAIAASAKFPIPEAREIPSECQKSHHDGHLFLFTWQAINNERPVPDINLFVLNGLLTVTPHGQPGNWFSDVTLSFTDAAKVYQLPSKSGLSVKLCDQVFNEITGIRTDEQSGTAVVEYSLRRTNWTPFGDYYRKQDSRAYPEVIATRATFTRYDDGWRLTPQ